MSIWLVETEEHGEKWASLVFSTKRGVPSRTCDCSCSETKYLLVPSIVTADGIVRYVFIACYIKSACSTSARALGAFYEREEH